MSLIKITGDDIKQGMPWADGWYKVIVDSTEIKESKDKKSLHYTPTYRINEHSDPDVMGRTLGGLGRTNFNSAAMGKIVPMLAAIEGIHVQEFRDKTKEKGIEFDFHSIKGKKLQVKIVSGEFEGNMVPKVVDYLPYDDKVPF